MSVLFLSHKPHQSHQVFAQKIGAVNHRLPFDWYVSLIKKWRAAGILYPVLTGAYALGINLEGVDVILVDGGSAIFTAVALKIRKPRLKLIFLDGDFFFYHHLRQPSFTSKWVLKYLDGVLSVSALSMSCARQCVGVPVKQVTPFPQHLVTNRRGKKEGWLYVGRLDAEKRIDRLIRLCEAGLIDSLKILGGRRAQLLHKHKNITYEEEKNPKDAYNKAEFFTHLPDFDPFPVTILEAIHAGCVPLVSKGVGTSEILDKIFVVQNPDNLSEVKKKINYLLSHREQARRALKVSQKKILSRLQAAEKFGLAFKAVLADSQ